MAYRLLIFQIHGTVISRQLFGQNLLLVQFMNCQRPAKLLLALHWRADPAGAGRDSDATAVTGI
jgi:hypothetical protein